MCLKDCSLVESTTRSDIHDCYVTNHSTWLKQLPLSTKGPWGYPSWIAYVEPGIQLANSAQQIGAL